MYNNTTTRIRTVQQNYVRLKCVITRRVGQAARAANMLEGLPIRHGAFTLCCHFRCVNGWSGHEMAFIKTEGKIDSQV